MRCQEKENIKLYQDTLEHADVTANESAELAREMAAKAARAPPTPPYYGVAAVAWSDPSCVGRQLVTLRDYGILNYLAVTHRQLDPPSAIQTAPGGICPASAMSLRVSPSLSLLGGFGRCSKL